MDKLAMLEQELLTGLKRDFPAFQPGDIITVHYKIKEKEKERVQPLEGVVIKLQGAMHRKSFTIRRISYGEAYEITFPYYSPNIEKIDIAKKVAKKARRSRLYYMRDRIGKQAMLA